MYYVIEISTTDKVNKAIYGYENEMEAVGTFHQKVGNAMKSEATLEELCMVVDEVGTIYATDHFKRPVPEPVVEEEPIVEPIEEAGDE